MSAPSIIDFRRSLPPFLPDIHSYLAGTINALAAERDLGHLTHHSVPRGSQEDRAAGAALLQPRFTNPVEPSRLVITNGTQNAILILLRSLVGVNGLLLAERLSYGALRALARCADVRLQGLDLDDDGIVPSAFEAVCRTQHPKALYCNPTVQNPTASVMSENRRRTIAEIARRYGVAIIEDEALGRLHPGAPKPIAALAPDISWYVMSTTKCLTQGLRLAYLLAPSAELANRLMAPIEHLTYWHPAPLLAALVSRWVTSGAADEISACIARECIVRERIARDILGGPDLRSVPGAMHVWLNLPASWQSAEFVAAAEARQVLIRPSELFAVDDQAAPNAVRLSLSSPDNIQAVAQGLETVGALIARKS